MDVVSLDALRRNIAHQSYCAPTNCGRDISDLRPTFFVLLDVTSDKPLFSLQSERLRADVAS